MNGDRAVTKNQIKAIVNCLSEAITGLGIGDDCDEAVAYGLDDQPERDVIAWAKDWDIAIEFHNQHCKKSAKFSKPWVLKEVQDQIAERKEK